MDMRKQLCWISLVGLVAVMGLLDTASPLASAQTPPSASPAAARLAARMAGETFAGWADRHRGRPPTSAELTEGLRLAEVRADAMRRLLETDPEAFVRQALPEAERAALPPQVRDRVERRLSGRGFFGVYCVLPTNHTATAGQAATDFRGGFRREARLDGVTYRVHVFGKWKDVETIEETALDGVALDDVLVLGDSPPEEQPATGGRVPRLAPSRTGPNAVLYMIARFSDETTDPISDATVLGQMTVVSNFWMNNSYGTVSVRGLVQTNQPVDLVHITLPHPASYAATYNDNLASLLSDARSAASAKGFNYANYNLDVVVTTGSGFGYAGRAYVGSQGAHLVAGYTSLRTAGHELGHNLGLWHANYWRTDSTAPFGKDSVPGGYCADTSNAEWVEYGHAYSIMAGQSSGEIDDPAKPHYAAVEKVKLGWLSGSRVQYVGDSGVYRLFRHDHRDVTNNPRGIRIETAATDYTGKARRYWLNYRYAPWTTAQNWLRAGVQVDVCESTYASDGATLLDLTPYSSDAATPFYDPANPPGSFWTIDSADKLDAALVIGRTFSDQSAGIHVTPLAVGNAGANQEYVDVAIQLGSFPHNRAPVISALTATTNRVFINQSVAFNVQATDPDGDALAYAWDFDQTQVWTASGLNTNAATKSWNIRGQYRVMVTVSDMKGGVASDSIVVTVGVPPINRQILGRVLWSGEPVAGARVFASRGGTNQQALTESDGSYALTDLDAANDWVVNCQKEGLTFAAQFANPVSVVGGDAYGMDFHANESLPAPGGSTYSISGQVTDGANGVAGAEVSAGGLRAVTGANGNFTLANVVNDVYTLTVRHERWSFTPESRIVTIRGANSSGNNFIRVTPYSLAGRFYGPSTDTGAPAPLVFLSNGRSVAATKTTGANRYWAYTFSGVPPGTFVVGAELSGYRFYSTNFTNPLVITGSRSDLNFIGTNAPASGAVSGRVMEFGLPLAGVTVEARLDDNLIASTQTDTDGCFRLSQLTNAAYAIVPAKPGYTCSPQSQTILAVPASGVNFSATGTNAPPEIGAVAASPNPVATPLETAGLGVTAAGQPPLSYSWGTLSAPAPVSFNTNDGPGAASVEARFLRSGDYEFQVRITDANGFSATTNLALSVHPSPGRMVVTPYEVRLTNGHATVFSAAAWNAAGTPLAVSPEWTVSGGGLIDANGGLFATESGGPFRVVATAGSLVATGSVWITGEYPPILALQTLNSAGAEAGAEAIVFRLSRTGNTNVPVSVNLAIGGTASYPADYTVSGAEEFSASSARVSFAAGQTTADLILTPVDDHIAEGDETVSVTLLDAAAYDLGDPVSALALIADDDPQALVVSVSSLLVPEGATKSFTVQLLAEPTHDITVTTTRSDGDPDLTVAAGDLMVFTPLNWNVPQTVTLAAAEDADATAGNASFVVAAAGLSDQAVVATEIENDTQFIVVSTNTLLVSEGGTNILLVALNARPDGDLMLLATLSGDTNLALAGASTLLFTADNWNAPQPIAVFASGNLDRTNSQALLTLSAPGLPEVLVAVAEVDAAGLELVVSTSELVVAEAGTNSISVWLSIQPDHDVLVDLALSGDSNVMLVVATPLTFTPADWSVPQSVAIAAARDENSTNDYATLTLSAASAASRSVAITVVDDAPIVSVQPAGDPVEWGAEPGAFLLLRTGNTSQPLNVQFALGGSATADVDYVAPTSPILLPSGEDHLLLFISPMTDSLAEGDETVELTLLPDAGYALTNAASARLTIHDLPIDQWRFNQFTAEELAEPLISGDDADPDQDRIVNILEYAFGLNPKMRDVSGIPFATLETGRLTLHYRQSKEAVDLMFTPEARGVLDSGSWSADGLNESGQLDLGGFWWLGVQDSNYTTNTLGRFMRLKVTRP